MSRARHKKEHHKHRAKGGTVAYAGGGSNVMKEAHERKRGGRVHHMHGEGEEAHERHDHKARRHGGHVSKHHEHERKHGGRMEHEHEHERKHGGHVMKHHEHEAHRKHGGRVHHHRAKGGEVGSNKHPLSTASRVTKLKGEGPENFPSD